MRARSDPLAPIQRETRYAWIVALCCLESLELHLERYFPCTGNAKTAIVLQSYRHHYCAAPRSGPEGRGVEGWRAHHPSRRACANTQPSSRSFSRPLASPAADSDPGHPRAPPEAPSPKSMARHHPCHPYASHPHSAAGRPTDRPLSAAASNLFTDLQNLCFLTTVSGNCKLYFLFLEVRPPEFCSTWFSAPLVERLGSDDGMTRMRG